MFDKLSKKIGFTQTEVQVILFIVAGFIFGLVIKFYKDSNQPEYKHFDYSVQDSLFNFHKNHKPEKDTTANNTIDSKQELLEFSSVKIKQNKGSTLPGEKSIDINSADEKVLISLPGIGPSTARKILELREKRGKFTNLEELMDVKGIGNIKFKKIEKFLYIN